MFLGHAFPCTATEINNDLFKDDSLKKISEQFSYNFLNSGIMLDGHAETFKVSASNIKETISIKTNFRKKWRDG